MGEVVDLAGILERSKMIETFARLWKLAEDAEEDIRDNPYPYLERASKEVSEAYKVMSEIFSVLHTKSTYPSECIPYELQSHNQLQSISRLIDDYYKRH